VKIASLEQKFLHLSKNLVRSIGQVATFRLSKNRSKAKLEFSSIFNFML